jgi:hypothetical protein
MNRPKLSAVVLIALTLLILAPAICFAQSGNISPSQRFAWMEEAGWVDFEPAGGGVTIGPTFLSGYAWGESVGWVKLGSTGGGPYANSGATNWGVNRSFGIVSGYAWSETAGWIDFAPSGGGVTLDATTGQLSGFAWSETLGWISFRGGTGAQAYGVSETGPDPVGNVPTLPGAGLMALVGALGAAGIWLVRSRGA